jgi:MoaA/NifB/PqqE/SkfB family radical SAM enzyme
MPRAVRPRKLRLEAMSVCQLRCPSCPTTTGAIRPAIAPGYLRLADFAGLVRASPRIRHVELSNFGEILLNPELPAILAHAHRHGVVLSADNGLNLNTASDEVLEAMVRHRFHSATVSIDGASRETYARYRVRGDFDRVIAHVRRLNHYKAAYASDRPRLVWQFVVFGHNEHELPLARRMAAELGMGFRAKLSYDDAVSPLRDPARVRRELPEGVATREEFERTYGVHYTRAICHQLWTQPQLNWDGTVLGCCVNYWGDFGGNAFRDGLDAALDHPKIRYAREMLLGRREPRADIPCASCAVYRSMRRSGRWLTRTEIRLRHSRLAARLVRVAPIRALVRRVRTLTRLRRP